MLVSPTGEVVTSLPEPQRELLLDCYDCELREIVFWPDSRLSSRVPEVEDPTSDAVRKLAGDLAYTMYSMRGVGLSANQVGENIRMFVTDITNGMKKLPPGVTSQLLVFVNPKLVWNNGELERGHEGCLSVPSGGGMVKRHTEIIVEAVDLRGQPVSLHTSGFLGRTIQHEVDHLDGVIMFERMERYDRKKSEEAYAKFQKAIQNQMNFDADKRRKAEKQELEVKDTTDEIVSEEADEPEVEMVSAPTDTKKAHRKLRGMKRKKRKGRR